MINATAVITLQHFDTVVSVWQALERLPTYQTHQILPASQQLRSPLTIHTHIHTHTHVCIHAYTHTHTRTHTRIHTYTYTHTQTHTHTHTHIHIILYTQAHAYNSVNTYCMVQMFDRENFNEFDESKLHRQNFPYQSFTFQ